MSIASFEKQLAEARANLERLRASRASLAETLSAFEAISQAQRKLAAARGEEHAIPYDIGFVPEAAASEPVLLQTDYTAFLTFSAMRIRPNQQREKAGYGVVRIDLCSLTKFGYPNDEALEGHPLYERGLSAYGVFEVKNSLWIKAITAQNRVAFPNTPDSKQRHFIFTFHDSTFECIARGIDTSVSEKTYQEVFEEIRRISLHRD